jgi:hypothetical protein
VRTSTSASNSAANADHRSSGRGTRPLASPGPGRFNADIRDSTAFTCGHDRKEGQAQKAGGPGTNRPGKMSAHEPAVVRAGASHPVPGGWTVGTTSGPWAQDR